MVYPNMWIHAYTKYEQALVEHVQGQIPNHSIETLKKKNSQVAESFAGNSNFLLPIQS
jgi:hypothetical protein